MLAKAAYVYRAGPCSARANRCSIEHCGTGIESTEALAEQGPTESTCQTIHTIPQRQAAAPAVPGGGGARGSAGGGFSTVVALARARQRGWGLQHCAHCRSAHLARGSAGGGFSTVVALARARKRGWGPRFVVVAHDLQSHPGRRRSRDVLSASVAATRDPSMWSSATEPSLVLDAGERLRSIGSTVERSELVGRRAKFYTM